MSFYQHMQSVQYRQDLEHEIAIETVHITYDFLQQCYLCCCVVFSLSLVEFCLQCFDNVGWAARRASGL